ncbi:MAG: hypothetical protein EOP51_32260, partial [Sphingobacteriales bacterium]
KTELSRNEQSISPTENNGDAIASSTGLKLAKAGDFAVFRMINNASLSPGIPNYTNTNGDTVTLGMYEGTAYQKWRITDKGKGYYTFKNQGSGKNLQSYQYKTKYELVQIEAYNTDEQLWQIVPITANSYKIINKASGRAITANGNGRIKLTAYTGTPSQTWGFNMLPADDLIAKTFAVSNVLQKNMVVQRDKPFTVWGRATANSTVTVKASWNTGLFSAKADGAGNWELPVPSSPANATPQTLVCSVNGLPPVKLTNLLIGDVWVCSGQSNMNMPIGKLDDPKLEYIGFNGVKDYQAVIAAANQPTIRVFTEYPIPFEQPQNDLNYQAYWAVCSPEYAGKFSAIGYFFAKYIDSRLHVPVGIIVAAVAGVGAETLTPKPNLEASPALKAYYGNRNMATFIYNGLIHPIRKLSIK